MSIEEQSVDYRLRSFAEYLLDAEMKLAQAMTEDPNDGHYGTAFSWVNHVRHTLKEMFKEELNEPPTRPTT